MHTPYLKTKRGRARHARRLTRFIETSAVPHPPVKGISARKSWKNVSMTRRLRLHLHRRLLDERLKRVATYIEDHARLTGDADLTIL